MQPWPDITNPGFLPFLKDGGELTSEEWRFLLFSAAAGVVILAGLLMWFLGERVMHSPFPRLRIRR